MDANFNNFNYNANDENRQNGFTLPDQQQIQPEYTAPQPEKKKRGGKFLKAAAIVAAVALVAGGSGFGGAYIASNLFTPITAASPSGTADGGRLNATYNIEEEKPSENSGTADGNVDSALNAISDSVNRGIAVKTYPTNVIPTGPNGEYTASELYEAVNDTIVLIKVYTDNNINSRSYDYYDYYFGFGEKPEESKKNNEPVYSGYGSGIVFTDDGYILTNAHVVDGASKLVVEVNDYDEAGKTYEYEADVIGADTSSDIAVIKIKRDEPFIAAKIGDSDSLKVGQSIGVIGNPGIDADIMFSHTLTTGIVSGLDVECLADNGYSLSLIQTDAAINSGNSGGGMFDMYGNVVGVVNSKIIATTYEGIGFALTINEAKPIMQDLLTYGYVKSRPVLGITTVELTEYRAELYGAKLSKGLLVTALNEGAPVEKSGLKIADIITKINGKNVESVRDVQTIIGKFRIGDKVTATVARVNGLGGVDSIDVDIELTESLSK